jgi:hypothetical protein
MRALSLAVATVAALGLAACPGPNNEAIPCADSALCNIEMGGQCIASPLGVDLCAYPTGDCASGLEWGPHSGGLSGECVAADVDASVIDAGTDAPPDGTEIDGPTGGIIINFQPADLVLGQPDFITETRNNNGPNDRSLAEPTGIGSDGTALWVADANNGRAMKWPVAPTVSFAAATGLLGRSTFTDGSANTVITASNIGNSVCCGFHVVGTPTKVVITDLGRHRAMVWATAPVALGQAPDFYLGQTSATSGSFGTSATQLRHPSGAWTDGTRLVIADRGNNRVLIWTTFPTTNGEPADLVLGQPDFVSGAAQAPSASSLADPFGVYSDGIRLFVADKGNNRVLVWTTFPTTNGEPADLVLGQATFGTATASTGAAGMSRPQGITVAGDALFVADGGNDRVIVYSSIPAASGSSATLVLGQPSLNSIGADNIAPTQANLDDPTGLAVLGPYLYVADHEHHRVVRYALNL